MHIRPPTSLTQLALLLFGFLLIGVEAFAQNNVFHTGLRVITETESSEPIPGVSVEIRNEGKVVATGQTDDRGRADFPAISAGTYDITLSKSEYQPVTQRDVKHSGQSMTVVRVELVKRLEIKEGVEVEGKTEPAQAPTVPAGEFGRGQLYELANRPTTVADSLPLVPGVVRTQDGEISIAGSGEHRSALVVNSADVTDPTTGQFGMTIPVDSVEKIEVFTSPFLAQFGRFTAGVVSVETRRGGEKWSFDVRDPLPAFRFRSGHLAGLLNASPRILFNGPLIKDKLYFSEGVEYRLFKDPVRTLPHPNREMKTESINSFTQLDYIASPTHTLTATLHIAPKKILYANLNYFDPRPVSPSFSSRDYTGTVIDRATIGGHLLESVFAVKRYGSDVWGQGTSEMVITPVGNTGSYWNEQARSASRYEWIEQLTPTPFTWNGTHNLRLGVSVTRTESHGEFNARTVKITDFDGRLLQRIDFSSGSRFNPKDTEVAFYGQNHWVLKPNLAINFGARIEGQEIVGNIRTAPRFGFSWSPGGAANTVIRGGAGIFYDRVPLSVYGFDHYPDRVVTTYSKDGSIVDGPRTQINVIGGAQEEGSLINYSRRAGNFSPLSATWNVELGQRFGRYIRARLGYLENQSNGLMLITPMRVDGRDALVLTGSGSSRYRQFEATAKVAWDEEENLVMSYVRSSARGDLNEFNEYLGNFPLPVIRPTQYANLSTDMPHRFLAYGLIKFPWRVRLAPLLEYRSGFVYSTFNERQQYAGEPNSDRTRFPHFYSLDLRVMKDFDVPYKKRKYPVRISFVGYNVTNHFNPIDVHRNTADPEFGVFFGKYRRWFKLDFEVFF